MKYKEGNFFQVSKTATDKIRRDERHKTIYPIYVSLCELEHKYTSRTKNFFYQGERKLGAFTGYGRTTLSWVIAWLKKEGLIDARLRHFIDKKTGKRSREHITCFRIKH